MDLKMSSLNTDLIESIARSQTELKQLFQRSRSDFDSLAVSL